MVFLVEGLQPDTFGPEALFLYLIDIRFVFGLI